MHLYKIKLKMGPFLFYSGIIIILFLLFTIEKNRNEELICLKKNETLTLKNDYKIILKSMNITENENRTFLDGKSEFDVVKNDNLLFNKEIFFKKPLNAGFLKIFQHSFKIDYILHFKNKNNEIKNIEIGQALIQGDTSYIFIQLFQVMKEEEFNKRPKFNDPLRIGYLLDIPDEKIYNRVIVVEEWKGEDFIKKHYLRLGIKLNEYELYDFSKSEKSAIRIENHINILSLISGFIILLTGLVILLLKNSGNDVNA